MAKGLAPPSPPDPGGSWIEIFEKHGFIRGGKWDHYDTRHFEYRPDLLLNRKSDSKAPAQEADGGEAE